ncbi:MAG: NADH-quinone oxidoreductase subunit J [Cytophagia bacterium]|nr:MAG: NADH-quinone oxidoreductase subunit J [Cytophagales bacterium]TAG34380.1 MAG: NADH-quinone oxidoreductase subunit J [Cytophagia bacterium]TAG69447.1 MAG: NADH-quinone oxidoreductase subunit J [Runella slithyformis]TAG76615.1 MAG: NADH-quinone oxidoreductase subunit J [Cytophagales bacterium]
MADKLFYFLSFLALLSAMMVVTAKNPIHSVLYLILTFFCLSGHYVLLNAQFVAVVNIIVYAGAIMVLFLFVIMFLNLKQDDEEAKTNLTKIAATIVGGTLGVILVAVFRKAQLGTYNPYSFNSQVGMVENLGEVLYNDYLLPFELASVLFLIAMVGAVMLAKREVGDRHF